MKIIDGKGSMMGRVASYSAKEALKGEQIAIINCEKLVISGNKEFIKENFEISARRHGTSQKGPIIRKTPEKMVKRVIRGMLPNHRWGRGKEALGKIKCYVGIPKEFEGKKVFSLIRKSKGKGILVGELLK